MSIATAFGDLPEVERTRFLNELINKNYLSSIADFAKIQKYTSFDNINKTANILNKNIQDAFANSKLLGIKLDGNNFEIGNGSWNGTLHSILENYIPDHSNGRQYVAWGRRRQAAWGGRRGDGGRGWKHLSDFNISYRSMDISGVIRRLFETCNYFNINIEITIELSNN